jgi:predicted component of type VI protein secretion system
VREQHGRATKKLIRHLERTLEASEARIARVRVEADARERELLERIDELEESVRRHHNVILDGRAGLSMLMLQPEQSDYIVGLMSKIHDQLDTRLR